MEEGCCPSIETYNAIINGLSKDNQFVKAEKLCKRMEKQGLVPNVITYTSLIGGLCKSGRTDLAFKIFHEMGEQGCLPNLYTYSSLMFGLCQEGKADNAETLLDEMERKGLAPDVAQLPNICHVGQGLQKESQLLTENVVGLMAQHEAMYSCSSDESYNFFEALCNLLARMSENGCEPTVDTYGDTAWTSPSGKLPLSSENFDKKMLRVTQVLLNRAQFALGLLERTAGQDD
ncbi:pentatricopeptide repeat-containing protein [Prunus yedoensis var. nudiflora]|uniref:Pentatricopeptide repeat-containing protein n=1 Tax=Prunus yedoensis var. nudiflora TaxID=2094558 RepID=A0A314UWE7_PRUYE|nr:pentatricopeptide repeat-containing protein [Prunus yedoensis var. nudiflora]